MEIKDGLCYMSPEEWSIFCCAANPSPLSSMSGLFELCENTKTRLSFVQTASGFKSEESQQREIQMTAHQLEILQNMAAIILVHETTENL